MSDLGEIRDRARAFVDERGWQKFQDPKSVLLALVGEVGEVAELLQWLPSDQARELARKEPLRHRLEDELADVLIYLVGLADECDVDLAAVAKRKIELSSMRYPAERHYGVAPDRTRPQSTSSDVAKD